MENPVDKQFVLNQFALNDEIIAQIEREDELRFTEIAVCFPQGAKPKISGEPVKGKEGENCFRFAYSAELLDFIRQDHASAVYYKRDLDEDEPEAWELISTAEILAFMK